MPCTGRLVSASNPTAIQKNSAIIPSACLVGAPGQMKALLNIIELGPERQLPKEKKAESQKETLPFLGRMNLKGNLLGLQYAKRVIIYWLPEMPLFPLKEKMHGHPRSHQAKCHPNFLF